MQLALHHVDGLGKLVYNELKLSVALQVFISVTANNPVLCRIAASVSVFMCTKNTPLNFILQTKMVFKLYL